MNRFRTYATINNSPTPEKCHGFHMPPVNTGSFRLNDVLGGRFDIAGDWAGSHNSHRVGLEVDSRTWSITYKSDFLWLVEENDGSYLDEKDHYHLRFTEGN